MEIIFIYSFHKDFTNQNYYPLNTKTGTSYELTILRTKRNDLLGLQLAWELWRLPSQQSS